MLAKDLLAKAEAAMRQVLDIAEKNFGQTSSHLASPVQGLAQVLVMEQKFAEALNLEKRLLSIEQSSLPSDSRILLQTRADIAATTLASGDSTNAVSQLKGLLSDATRILGINDPFVGAVQDTINQVSQPELH